jgi:hypothetical protein
MRVRVSTVIALVSRRTKPVLVTTNPVGEVVHTTLGGSIEKPTGIDPKHFAKQKKKIAIVSQMQLHRFLSLLKM